jgi:hypothetical protein
MFGRAEGFVVWWMGRLGGDRMLNIDRYIKTLKYLLPLLLLLSAMTSNATENQRLDDNFMLVLREVEGANKQELGFDPSGPMTATLANGESATLESAWFNLIGDMHVRFVIDSEYSMQNLTAEEFSALGLTPQQAADIAITNIKKRYGAPKSTPWEDGIMLVSGGSPDLDSSYFLDKAFWMNLLQKHPEGLVVGVPKRGGLIYAPLSDKHAVTTLERNIRFLYESSDNMRVSAALYLFKDNKWTVYRKPASLH